MTFTVDSPDAFQAAKAVEDFLKENKIVGIVTKSELLSGGNFCWVHVKRTGEGVPSIIDPPPSPTPIRSASIHPPNRIDTTG